MQKLITYIEAVDPTLSNNVAAGFAVGHFWRNSVSGKLFYHKLDGVWESHVSETDYYNKSEITNLLSSKKDNVNEVAILTGNSYVMADNAEYRAAAAVSSLTFTSPASGNYECWIKFTTESSGAVTVSLPNGIVGTPTIGNSETWEISVKDGVAIALKTS